MKKVIISLVASLCAIISMSLNAVTVQDGVSLELATYRSANINDVRYSLTFTVPDQIARPVSFDETLTFVWAGDEDLQIDFQGRPDQLDSVITVNGRELTTDLRHEHIVIPQGCLLHGKNQVIISGRCGDKALNRHEDYLYSLFVPDHARSVFPCFDQPDLKARFALSLTLPDGWISISNDTQKPIPTYLFSFTAGRFQMQTATRDGRDLTALYRETDSLKVGQLPIVFDQVALSLRWMEEYTGIPYPFEKYGFVVLPGYQFGGMEHPGCIQFTDWEIFLGPQPTPDEEMTRLNLIAHETAHMWFGDLVTMRWFNDVWTKEVFANFMADKISREQFPDVNHDLAFIKAHYPLAMNTDRTRGTHPIQQPLDNLNKAGLLYGNIIYHKAPIMMRKLEQEKGATALQQGLRSYLTRYAYGNATWDDLIAELDKTNLLSELASAQSNLANAQSTLTYQTANYNRYKTLYQKGLVSANDYENARMTYEQARQQIVVQQQNVKKARTNLGYATITAPIDGVVLSKEVEEGQTVASAMTTPTLFIIAKDLTDMRVIADIDEADIGGVQSGQRVSFTVDAFPDDVFQGFVTQVRQQATTESNVVTYEVVISARNDALKLKPGLTANVTIFTSEKNNVLAVPTKALRFTPTEVMLAKDETIENVDAPQKVWKQEGKVFKAYAVTTGTTNGVLTEITSGLKEGDEIITEFSIIGGMDESADAAPGGNNPFMPRRPNNRRSTTGGAPAGAGNAGGGGNSFPRGGGR